jgi:predicted GNAT family acetyltransferase
LDITYYANATDFLARTGAYLAKDEARYGLILGLAKGVQKFPERYAEVHPWFCSIGNGKVISAAAMRTPPNMVIVAHFSGDLEAITEKLATAVAASYEAVPGVVGDKELADVFARRWCESHKVKITHTMAQRIYRLDKVNKVPLSPGRFRPATMAEKELVIKWVQAFSIDAMGGGSAPPEKDIMLVIGLGWVFFWEDGKPVSMAHKSRPTDKGMSVSGVYTPPELRSKGYATSCVAELSRDILKSGKKFCMLYTDLANPTSNSIYMKIGYKPVGDSVQHTFEMPEKTA